MVAVSTLSSHPAPRPQPQTLQHGGADHHEHVVSAVTERWKIAPRASDDGLATTTRRPMERAQEVWARAIELAAPPRYELFGVILEVLRTARHDSATVTHALTLGRSRLRDDPTDEAARRATRLLQRCIEFLGVKPRSGDVGNAGSWA
jgi:hypothetical protein